MNILEIRNLKKSFGDLQAVNNLSLTVEKGEVLGILGPNGAGKSTTIGCITGLVSPDSGDVIFDGGHSFKKWKQHIGYVPQELAIYDELTAEENVSFFCSLYGTSDVKNKVKKALDFVGLMEVKDKKTGTFSGGMKRRLNLACGIAHEPELVIMDEPTVGIDPQSRNRILENVKKLNQKGTTILYTTHYMPEAEEICNRLTVVDHGEVITAGTKQKIVSALGKNTVMTIKFRDDAGNLDDYVSEVRAYRGVSNISAEHTTVKITYAEDSLEIDKVISAATGAGMIIEGISTEEPALEEVFLLLTGDGFDYFRSSFNEANGGEIVRSLFQQLTENGLESNAVIQNTVLDVEKPDAAVYYTFAGLALAIMFMGVLVSNSYGRDFGSDTFSRISMSKAGLSNIVLSKLICGIVCGVVQIAIAVGVSTLVFGIKWENYFGFIIMIFIALLIFSLCLGSMLGSLIKKESVAYPVVSLCAMLSAYLGGSITPIYLLERLPVMKHLVRVSPVYWTNQSLTNLYNGINDDKTRNCIIVLLAAAMIFIAVTMISASNTKMAAGITGKAERADGK